MNNYKIVIVGPVAPFRGGISHFLTSLTVHMSKLCDIYSISFKKLYPKFLYPGKFQKEVTKVNNLKVNYTIDTLNPITWINTLKNIYNYKPDAVIFTYWTSYLFLTYYFLIFFLKKKNIKIVINFHNLRDHESKSIGSFFSKQIIKMSNFIIYEEINLEEKKLIKLNENAKFKYLIKPCNQVFDLKIEPFKRNASLELLFYGFIRHYKGLDILLEAMSFIKNKIDFHLSIVGEIWFKNKNFWELEIKKYNLKNNVTFDPNYVDEEITTKYFKRADYIVMPYRSVTGSGILPMAYYFNKSIIASNIGNLPELIKNDKMSLLFNVCDSLDLSKKILMAHQLKLNNVNVKYNDFNKKYNFDNYTKKLKDFIFN